MKKRNHRNLSAVLTVLCVWPLLFLASCRHGGHSVSETGGADSVYTLRHIRSIAIEHPERALALIDTAEKKRLLTAFDINDLRSLVYHNGLSRYKTALFYARKAYNDPEARKDPRRYLSLLSIMADESRSNGDYTGSMKYCTEGLELAKELGDKTYEANLNVMWGMSQMEMAQYDEAFASIGFAIGLLEEEVRKDPSYHAWDELYYALGMKLALLFEKDRNEEAYAMRPLIKKAIQGLEKSEDTPEGLVDMRRAEADVCFSCVAYTLGDKAEGDSLYRRVEANPYASTPDGEYIRIPCLVLAKRYDEALYYIRREKKLLQETTDTVSWDYINPHLQAELEAWQGKGDWRSVARVLFPPSRRGVCGAGLGSVTGSGGRLLAGGDVETGLTDLILHVAQSFPFQVAQHFGQHHFQVLRAHVLHRAPALAFHFLKAFPADVESCAIRVGGDSCRISVPAPEPLHVFPCAQHGSYDHLVGVQSFGGQRVEEVASYLVKQGRRSWREVGDGVGERVHGVMSAGLDVPQSAACSASVFSG